MSFTTVIHHPYRLKEYAVRQIGTCHDYVDPAATEESVNRFADASLPVVLKNLNAVLSRPRAVVHLAVSGTVVDLLQQYRPDALQALAKMVTHQRVCLVATTYYQAPRSVLSQAEYNRQAARHRGLMESVFGKAVTEGPPAWPVWKKDAGLARLQKLAGLESLICGTGDEKTFHQWRLLQDAGYWSDAALQGTLQNITTDLQVSAILKKLPFIRSNRPHLLLLL